MYDQVCDTVTGNLCDEILWFILILMSEKYWK